MEDLDQSWLVAREEIISWPLYRLLRDGLKEFCFDYSDQLFSLTSSLIDINRRNLSDILIDNLI